MKKRGLGSEIKAKSGGAKKVEFGGGEKVEVWRRIGGLRLT
jgi:hypothetical protein